jgi:hypothetical protein
MVGDVPVLIPGETDRVQVAVAAVIKSLGPAWTSPAAAAVTMVAVPGAALAVAVTTNSSTPAVALLAGRPHPPFWPASSCTIPSWPARSGRAAPHLGETTSSSQREGFPAIAGVGRARTPMMVSARISPSAKVSSRTRLRVVCGFPGRASWDGGVPVL